MAGLTVAAGAAGAPVRQDHAGPRAGRPQHRGAGGLQPILRHQDRDLYYREHGDRIGIGSYAHRPMPVGPRRRSLAPTATAAAMPSVLPFTEEDFDESWARHPDAAAGAGRDQGGARASTASSPSPPTASRCSASRREVRGFWVAEAVWVTHSAGVATAMAEWLVDGTPRHSTCTSATSTASSRSSSPRDYVRQRGCQNFVEVYDIIHPLQPLEDPRPLRVSPFHARQRELGAVFLEACGWERPHWYEANAGLPEVDRHPRPRRLGLALLVADRGAEALATRERVAMYDMTAAQTAGGHRPGRARPSCSG